MELSANWNKLKAKLDRESSAQKIHNNPEPETKSLRRKRKAATNLAGTSEKKTRLIRTGMADEIGNSESGTADAVRKDGNGTADQINQGLSDGYAIFILEWSRLI